MLSNTLGRRLLLTRLERMISECLRNNDNSFRYPVTWPDGSRLRGHKTLQAESVSMDELLEGRYIFGANELFIYRALDKVLTALENALPPGAMDELFDRIEEARE